MDIISKSEFEVQTSILQQKILHKTMEIGSKVEAGQSSKGRGCY